MNSLRIFVDFALPEHVWKMLEEGTKGHELVRPAQTVSSILAKADRDPQFASVDIAYGQPDLRAIEEAGKLKWVEVSSSGITRYDTPEFRSYAASRNLIVTNSALAICEACAVHILSFMLAQARNLPPALRTRTAGGRKDWHALRGSARVLRGESVLIVGYGAIGNFLVDLLRPFDMQIVAYRRKARGDEGVPIVTHDQLPEALAAADHVVNILPASEETCGFFDAEKFSTMKQGAVFYNIGRGTTVDQNALLDVLRSGRLRSAWLDVTDPEPLPDEHPLWAEPNCFITPHIAGGRIDEAENMVRHFLDNFRRFVNGEPLIDRVM